MSVLEIEVGLLEYLNDDATLSALVSSRIYILALPQKPTLPAITYRRISTSRLMSHDQTASGLSTVRFQFDVYGDTYTSAKETVIALQGALLGYKGKVTKGADSVHIGSILSALEQDGYEPDVKVYRITVDYFISHEE